MTKQSTKIVSTDQPEQEQENTSKVYWAVPMGETLNVDAFRSFLGVAWVCGAYKFENIPVPRMRTDLARNSIIHTFLSVSKHPNDTLVMLDNDHVHPATVVRDLVMTDAACGVVGALAYRRGEPYDPVVFIRTAEDGMLHPLAQWGDNKFIECDMVGHGAIAIRRWVFDKLKEAGYNPPYYRYQYREDGTAPSEDMYFGQICEATGIKHYCRLDVVIPHITNYFIDGDDWQKYMDTHPGSIKQQDKVAEPEVQGIGALSIIIPSKGRPEQLRRMLEQLRYTTQGQIVELMVIAGADDAETIKAAQGWARVETMPLDHNAIEAWNYGAAIAKHEWVMLGSDDLWFEPGWFEEVMNVKHRGFIGLPDGHTDERLATHYIASKQWLLTYNGGVLAIPKYRSWFIDTEISERAHRSGTYAFCKTDKMEHRHTAWKTAPDDETYKRGRAFQEKDRELFKQRKAAGFPDDFDPVLTTPQWSST